MLQRGIKPSAAPRTTVAQPPAGARRSGAAAARNRTWATRTVHGHVRFVQEKYGKTFFLQGKHGKFMEIPCFLTGKIWMFPKVPLVVTHFEEDFPLSTIHFGVSPL